MERNCNDFWCILSLKKVQYLSGFEFWVKKKGIWIGIMAPVNMGY